MTENQVTASFTPSFDPAAVARDEYEKLTTGNAFAMPFDKFWSGIAEPTEGKGEADGVLDERAYRTLVRASTYTMLGMRMKAAAAKLDRDGTTLSRAFWIEHGYPNEEPRCVEVSTATLHKGHHVISEDDAPSEGAPKSLRDLVKVIIG